MTVKIFVTPRPNVRNPPSEEVLKMLREHFGFKEAARLSLGRYYELTVDGSDVEEVRRQMTQFADKSLANPIMENFRIEISA